jgi:hypothetical protein
MKTPSQDAKMVLETLGHCQHHKGHQPSMEEAPFARRSTRHFLYCLGNLKESFFMPRRFSLPSSTFIFSLDYSFIIHKYYFYLSKTNVTVLRPALIPNIFISHHYFCQSKPHVTVPWGLHSFQVQYFNINPLLLPTENSCDSPFRPLLMLEILISPPPPPPFSSAHHSAWVVTLIFCILARVEDEMRRFSMILPDLLQPINHSLISSTGFLSLPSSSTLPRGTRVGGRWYSIAFDTSE